MLLKHLRAVHAELALGPGLPVNRDLTVDGPNRLWITDITEHPTEEGTCTARQ